MGIRSAPDILCVSLNGQVLRHYRQGKETTEYPVSTSKNPPSRIENSFGTPPGLHEVADKIGEGAGLGMVFKGRVAIGKRYWELSGEENEENLVTTRILRLRGLEPGKNAGPGRDSYDRMIYIHGTNREDQIGAPFTGGCIVLKNGDMIRLFGAVPKGTPVWIE